MRVAIILGVILSTALAFADGSHLRGRVTDTATGMPIEGASVFLANDHGLEQTVTTDARGDYDAVPAGTGEYHVVFVFGSARLGRSVVVATNRDAALDATLDGAEVIEIHEKWKPPVHAVPKKNPLIAAPYSDDAIAHDTWTRAWLLLDINPRGEVTRVKFLKRPGHDLDKIAIAHAMKLRFEPARNSRGDAVPTFFVWNIEWPSYWWMIARTGFVTRIPARSVAKVPCRDSGRPLAMDSVHPVYRDCSMPSLTDAGAERWVAADAHPSPWIDAPNSTWSP